FLSTLELSLTIQPATIGDLDRSEELTQRTHQLNSTGKPYSRAELEGVLGSDRHVLLAARLEDRFGSYGQIGLVLLEVDPSNWTIKLLLTSCRVLSRGIGSLLLRYVAAEALKANVTLKAEFVPTERNRIMYVTFRLAGFQESVRQGELTLLERT